MEITPVGVTNTQPTETIAATTQITNASPARSTSPAQSINAFNNSIIDTGEHKSLLQVLRSMVPSPKPKTTLHAAMTTDTVKVNGQDVKKQRIKVRTDDGYTIKFGDENHDITITAPDGRSTKIWGDPHVTESDGDIWNFINGSSFVFGNNKITVDTVAIGNGQTIMKTLSIYNGHDRVTVSGIDKNIPKLEAWLRDGVEQDLAKADGDIYDLTQQNSRDAWVKRSS